jgi:hypothetical protein
MNINKSFIMNTRIMCIGIAVMTMLSIFLSSSLKAFSADPEKGVNLALNKKVFVSSEESANTPARAITDGDVKTRWLSKGKDLPAWVYIDLDTPMEFNWMVIVAHKLGVGVYKIQVSNDAKSWTDVVSRGALPHNETLVFDKKIARYVRLYITELTSNEVTSISIKEIEVYCGTPILPKQDSGIESGVASALEAKKVKPEGNLALNKKVFASSEFNEKYPAQSITDGSDHTRWLSNGKKLPAWLYIDLGAPTKFNRVVIISHKLGVGAYKIQVSNDAKSWKDIVSRRDISSKEETLDFDKQTARYVRFYITEIKDDPTKNITVSEIEAYLNSPGSGGN